MNIEQKEVNIILHKTILHYIGGLPGRIAQRYNSKFRYVFGLTFTEAIITDPFKFIIKIPTNNGDVDVEGRFAMCMI